MRDLASRASSPLPTTRSVPPVRLLVRMSLHLCFWVLVCTCVPVRANLRDRNKLAKDINSTLTISWGSQPPEMSLIEAEGAGKLNQKIEGIHGNVIQLVKHDHRDRLVNGEVANQETGHMSYELTERAWRAAEKVN